MKSIVLILTSLVSLSAFAKPDPEALKKALESLPNCQNFVRFDDQNLYLGYGAYKRGYEEPRKPIPAFILIAPIATPAEKFTLMTADASIDAISDGQTLYVLTYSGLEEWDLASKQRKAIHATYSYGNAMAYKEHAQAFARMGDKLIIAHGRLGVSFFDLKTKRLTNQFRLVQKQAPLESSATGVAINGNLAYVSMDNFSLVPRGKPAFRGLVVIDMTTERVLNELDGLDPFADGVLTDGKKILVSFGGGDIVWKWSLSDLRGSQMPDPEIRIWRYPMKGTPAGKAAMDEKYYYTCFNKAPEAPGGSYKNIPVALDRRVLILD